MKKNKSLLITLGLLAIFTMGMSDLKVFADEPVEANFYWHNCATLVCPKMW